MFFLKKFKSRKFIAALIGVATGIAMIFGVNEELIAKVSGAIVSAASLVTYIAVEGRIDAAAIADAAEKIEKAAEEVTGSD